MADSTLGRVSEGVKATATAAQERARDQLAETGDVLRHSASDAVQQARTKIGDVAEEQKHRAAAGIRGVAHSLHNMARSLEREHRDIVAQYAHVAADQLDRTAHVLDHRSMAEMADDVEAFAHRRPGVFVGGAFAAGFLLARLIRNSRGETPVVAAPAPRRRYGSAASGYAEYEAPLHPSGEPAGFTTTPTDIPGAPRPGGPS